MAEVNGGSPRPRHIPCEVFTGETFVAIGEFARFDTSEYLRVRGTYLRDLQVPTRFLPIAFDEADVFFVDLQDPDLRVLYWQYVEGVYGGPIATRSSIPSRPRPRRSSGCSSTQRASLSNPLTQWTGDEHSLGFNRRSACQQIFRKKSPIANDELEMRSSGS